MPSWPTQTSWPAGLYVGFTFPDSSNALLPVGTGVVITGTITNGLSSPTVTVQLGANAPVGAVITGSTWSVTITAAGGDVGANTLTALLTSGAATATATAAVDVENNLAFWLDASNSASYTQTGGTITSFKSLVTGTALSTVVGAPKFLTDIRDGKPAFWFDGSSYVTGADATLLAATNGTDKPHTVFVVFTPALYSQSSVMFSVADGVNSGNEKCWLIVGGGQYEEINGNPAGPTRDYSVAGVVAAGPVIFGYHSADGLTVSLSRDGGADTNVTLGTVGALASTNVGIGVLRNNAATLPMFGSIREILYFSADLSAAARARVVARLQAKWAKSAMAYFLGDSLTTAENTTGGGFRALFQTYCASVGRKIDENGPYSTGNTGAPDIYIRHSGVSGNKPSDMTTRVNDGTLGLGAGTPYAATKLVHLFAGTNAEAGDLGDGAVTATAYQTLLTTIASKLYGSQPTARIIVSTITDVQGSSAYVQAFNARLAAIWSAHDAANPNNRLLRADYYNAMGPRDPAYYVDTTHWNPTGYARVHNNTTYGTLGARDTTGYTIQQHLAAISP